MSFKLARLLAVGFSAALASSLSAAAIPSLGDAANFALLSVPGGTDWNLSKAYITGNVGVGDNGAVFNSLPSSITGNVYVTRDASQYSGPGTLTGRVVKDAALVSKAISDLTDADRAIRGLTATKTYAGGINSTSAYNITGNGGLNVIDIDGSLVLSGKSSGLFLNGTADDYFIVRISGNLDLSGNAFIGATGNVDASHVIFDFVGSSGSLATDKNNKVNGSIIMLNYSATLDGFFTNIYGGTGSNTITLQSGTIVTSDAFTPPQAIAPIPEAATVSLLGVAAMGLLMRRRKA